MTHSIRLIIGPTGSGKSDTAESWAAETPATLINADAQQVYRSLPTLRATPPPAPHHELYAILDSDARISTVEWVEAAVRLIQTRPNPIVVGGTALYVYTLLAGIPPVPPAPVTPEIGMLTTDALRALVRQHTPNFRYTDRHRLERAAAVYAHTGIPITEWQLRPRTRFPITVTHLTYTPTPTKEQLRTRVEMMVRCGAVDEVRQAGSAHHHVRPIGLDPVLDYINHLSTYATMIERWTDQMYQYARRQRTFFNKLIRERALDCAQN